MPYLSLERPTYYPENKPGSPRVGDPRLAPALSSSSPAPVNGFVITIHCLYGQLNNILNMAVSGNIARYNITGGRVIRASTLYSGGDVGFACISPDGQRVAFLRKNGNLCLVPAAGGPVHVVANLGVTTTYMQWPAAENGAWLYYAGGFITRGAKDLWRINLSTGQRQLAFHFDRALSSFGLSDDTTRSSGTLVTRVFDGATLTYPLAQGSGSLYNRPEVEGCGISESPDGRYFVVTTLTHCTARVHSIDGAIKAGFRVNQWAGPHNDGSNTWMNFRWSVDSPEWMAVTQGPSAGAGSSGPFQSNAVLYNWARGQQVQVTENPKGQYDRAQGFWLKDSSAAAPVQARYSGTAPFTVRFPVLPGDWSVDYGDGQHREGQPTPYAFQHRGFYTITARQGAQVDRALVAVEPRRALLAEGAQMLDPQRVAVRFNQPVAFRNARAVLDGTVGSPSLKLGPDGASLLITLKDPLPGSTGLRLDGITDTAQVPAPLQNPSLLVQYQAWPAVHQGLLYSWETLKSPNLVYEPHTDWFRSCCVVEHGLAGLDPNGGLTLSGGYSDCPEAGDLIRTRCQDSQELTVEAMVTPARDQQGVSPGQARIIDCFFNQPLPDFWLGQRGHRLLFYISGPGSEEDQVDGIDLAALPSGTTTHVMVSFRQGELACYVNGQEVKRIAGLRASFDDWLRPKLRLGGDKDPRYTWLGRLEGIAIYNKFLNEAQAQQEFQAYAALQRQRTTPAPLQVQAVLARASAIPTLQQIAPYRDAMVVDEYTIKRVVHGVFTGPRIRVAHRALVDGKPVFSGPMKIGQPSQLTLEPLDSHPELEQKYRSDTLTPDFDARLYVDVGG